MTKVYACLTGNWVCLNDDPECVFVDYGTRPSVWWEENAKVFAPVKRTSEMEDSMYYQEYVNIFYKGKTYRIHPMFIQIVHE